MIIPPSNRLEEIQEYYFSKKLLQVRALEQQGVSIINLGIGNPDLPPSKETIDILSKTASLENSHGYQPYRGRAELRDAIQRWYQQIYNVEVCSVNQVLPLLGSKEGMFYAAMAFLNPGDRVLVPDPGYPAYETVSRIAGAKVLRYGLNAENNWLPDLNTIDFSGIKIWWLNYPHMPTGAVAKLKDFQKWVDFALEHNILICHDNPYSLILNDREPLSILKADNAFKCCIELNSLSKSHHMAGWRIGMVAGAEAFLNTMLKMKSNVDSGGFLPIQMAAAQALNNLPEWHQAQNRNYRRRREYLYQLLELLGCSYARDTAGMFVWARVADCVEDVEVFLDQLLFNKGIFIAPGKAFGRNGERYLRVSVCTPEEGILKAIERIKN